MSEKDNSVYLGPGYWRIIHQLSRDKLIDVPPERLREEIINLCKLIASICVNFPCRRCKIHILTYFREHPFENLYDSNDNLVVFKYFFEMHNVVNDRLNKRIVPLEEAIATVMDIENCGPGCGEGEYVENFDESNVGEEEDVEETGVRRTVADYESDTESGDESDNELTLRHY